MAIFKAQDWALHSSALVVSMTRLPRLRGAVQKNPTYATTYQCLAAAIAQLRRHPEAMETAARVLQIEPISKYLII